MSRVQIYHSVPGKFLQGLDLDDAKSVKVCFCGNNVNFEPISPLRYKDHYEVMRTLLRSKTLLLGLSIQLKRLIFLSMLLVISVTCFSNLSHLSRVTPRSLSNKYTEKAFGPKALFQKF